MHLFSSSDELVQTLQISQSDLTAIREETVKKHIERLIQTYVFTTDDTLKHTIYHIIQETASKCSIVPTSINPLYRAIGQHACTHIWTTPAINIRTLTFDTAFLLFTLMKKHSIGPLLFEIAKSEMGYTSQRPKEYTTVILAAAIKADYNGPVFLQGDHFQLNLATFQKNQTKEVASIRNLIKEAIDAHFYNIDIDASTLVDLDKGNLLAQQQNNFEVTAELTKEIRKHQPEDVTISVGGEIGHIGGRNSTVADFEAFMEGYTELITTEGLSKVSVQTGSSHGGTVLPDGTIQNVSLDFSVLSNIGQVAREKYGLGGAVQHGASTLPLDLFDKFPTTQTLEIHLATGFQNTVFDRLPSDLNEEMYTWVSTHCQDEKKEGQTNDQFFYKTRKKALGPFKQSLWSLRTEEKQPIMEALTKQFETIFTSLNVYNTKDIIDTYIKP